MAVMKITYAAFHQQLDHRKRDDRTWPKLLLEEAFWPCFSFCDEGVYCLHREERALPNLADQLMRANLYEPPVHYIH